MPCKPTTPDAIARQLGIFGHPNSFRLSTGELRAEAQRLSQRRRLTLGNDRWRRRFSFAFADWSLPLTVILSNADAFDRCFSHAHISNS